jgi:hypothetical protein
MKPRRWIVACGTAVLVLFTVTAFPQGHGQGHGQGQGRGKHKGQAKQELREYRHYNDEREALHNWYVGRRGNLPPGLAKRDELPPGLQRQLVERGTLPPGLRKKYRPCPPELVRMLPPPPPECEHVLIGGRILLLNRRNFMIVDVFHFGM